MLKIVIVALVAALPVLFNAGQVKAQSRIMGGGNSGSCPAGTCSSSGGSFAKNVKNCTAANCAKGKGRSIGRAG